MRLGKQTCSLASFVVLFLISIIVFLSLLAWNLNYSRILHRACLVISFVPVIGFGAVSFLPRYREAMKRRTLAILIAMIVGFVLLTLGNIAVASTFDQLAPTRNTLAYTRILKTYGYPDSKGIAHFPQAISQNAEFYEEPSFGPNGTKIILKVQADPGAVADLMEKFLSLEQKTLDSEEYLESHMNRSSDILKRVIESNVQLGSPSEEYRMILLKNHAEPNCGEAYGFLIHERSGEIVYWYLEW